MTNHWLQGNLEPRRSALGAEMGLWRVNVCVGWVNCFRNPLYICKKTRLIPRSSSQRPSPLGLLTLPRGPLTNLRGHHDFLFHDRQSTEYIGQIVADHLIHILLTVHRNFHIPLSLISPCVPSCYTMNWVQLTSFSHLAFANQKN
jgi:hypothetical protein